MRSLFRFLACLPLLAACSEPNDRPSEIDSLRVLAVQSDEPYAAPSSSPQLEMLLVDGSPAAPRTVQTLWLGTCLNPSGDLYYNCYPVLGATLDGIGDRALATQQVPAGTPDGTIGFGTRFSARIPADAISSRPTAPGVIYPYGVVFVFFAACAGELRRGTDLPVACVRPGTNEQLGQDDFEFGYYPIYVYDTLVNHAPIASSLTFDLPGDPTPCANASACATGQTCGSKGVCIAVVPTCSAADADDCPGYWFGPVVDPSSVELALSSHIDESRAPLETIWVSYYATGGRFDKDSRIAHDGVSGFVDDYRGVWRAKDVSNREVALFAVVRDNRGGVTWLSRDVAVR
jgi:hypothetical protein